MPGFLVPRVHERKQVDDEDATGDPGQEKIENLERLEKQLGDCCD